ncbi:MAG: hypothetical protein QY312_00125 [Candidatus Dojkabacteria bacterium]|nr:MAG: hypothetical protein QY312_00125 [Candidatus Dojkabacteria bacterium]
MKRSYKYLAVIICYFLFTAIIAVSLGKAVDSQFNTRPFGQIIVMILMYLVSLKLFYRFAHKLKDILG